MSELHEVAAIVRTEIERPVPDGPTLSMNIADALLAHGWRPPLRTDDGQGRNWTETGDGAVVIAGRYDMPDIRMRAALNEILVTVGDTEWFANALDLFEAVKHVTVRIPGLEDIA